MNKQSILWIDLETTSLDEGKGTILEAAWCLTSLTGKTYASNSSFLHDHPLASLSLDEEFDYILDKVKDKDIAHYWDDEAYEMHEKSGLIDDWLDFMKNQYKDELESKYIPNFFGELKSNIESFCINPPYLGSANPPFEKRWLKRWTSNFLDCLHYRSINLRTLTIFAENTGIEIPDEFNHRKHRAMPDVKRDVKIYKYLYKTVENFLKIDEGMYEGLGA